MILLLQSAAVQSSPVWQKPVNVLPSDLVISIWLPTLYGVYFAAPELGTVVSGEPANEALSGQMPVSITPTTTPRPDLAVPPRKFQTPFGPESLRKSVDRWSSVTVTILSLTTDSTPAVARSLDACAGLRSAAKPFRATEYRLSGLAPTRSAILVCSFARYAWYFFVAALFMFTLRPSVGRVAARPLTPPPYVATGSWARVTM